MTSRLVGSRQLARALLDRSRSKVARAWNAHATTLALVVDYQFRADYHLSVRGHTSSRTLLHAFRERARMASNLGFPARSFVLTRGWFPTANRMTLGFISRRSPVQVRLLLPLQSLLPALVRAPRRARAVRSPPFQPRT